VSEEMDDIMVKLEASRPLWHQIFKMTLTKFEVPIELQIRCDRWEEGLRYVRARKLNNCLTIDCQNEQEARQQLYEAILVWFDDATLVGQNGQLIYWKLYDE
jgi:predicted RNase H-like HicB family nuclease